MSFRAVLFDWGGTLVHDDTLAPGVAARAVVGCLREELGIDVTAERFEAAFQEALPPYIPGQSLDHVLRIDDVIARALGALGVATAPVVLERSCLAFSAVDIAAQEVFDDARALLASLRYRGYRLAVVSNTIFPARLFEHRVRAAGFASYFDAVICSADVGRNKPHPAIYQAALDALSVAASEVLFVGDRLDPDIAGAEAAGIAAVRIDRRRDRSDPATRTIDRLSGLNRYLGEGVRS
ncbi:MAG: HAD family hydrolase [Dehalococcoidia bacterium]|nr:HAD family hydrolase [Dehalococcoidia bacterium]